MDLPTCPACKQSVLDEDAAECPFCGAAMKGGGAPGRSATAAAPVRSSPKAPAGRSAPPEKLDTARGDATAPAPRTTGASKAAPPRSAAPADDDPFAVDSSKDAKAIPVSAKAAPGKSLEVKCPMCETSGFVSPKAAGQSVKCCNPRCLVPIFTVPAPKKAEPPPPPPPAKASPLLIYGGIAAAAVILGGLGIWLSTGPTQRPSSGTMSFPAAGSPGDAPAGKFGMPGAVADGDAGPAADPDQPPPDKPGDQAAVVAAAPENLLQEALRQAVEASLRAPGNRKAFCRRMAALGYANSGDIKGAQEQLAQLQKIGSQTPYEACLPTAAVAWMQLAKSPKAADATIAEAVKLTRSLPQRGRHATQSALAVAALLAATEKYDEARSMLADHRGPPQVEQLAAALEVVQHQGTYDLDAPLAARLNGEWLSPLETGVTLILAARGRSTQAQAWAARQRDDAARAECTIALAETQARSAPASEESQSAGESQAARGQSPAVEARLLARLSAVRLDADDRAGAEELLSRAVQALSTVPAPQAVRLSGAKSLIEWKSPDVAALRLAALAAADIGGVQQRLGQADAAWKSFEAALRFLQGTAPSVTVVQQRLAQLQGTSAEALRAELKRELQLRTDDQVRRAVTDFRLKTEELAKGASNRFLWQTALLAGAAEQGLVDQVWSEVRAAESRPEPADREPLLSSVVPAVVAHLYEEAGKTVQRDAVAAVSQERQQALTPEQVARVVRVYTQRTNAAGNFAETLNLLGAQFDDAGTLHEWALQLACRLVRTGQTGPALQFVSGLSDGVLREEGLFLIAAQSALAGKGAEVWQTLAAGLPPPETAATCAGLASGLSPQETSRRTAER